jgi:hypothetical protein
MVLGVFTNIIQTYNLGKQYPVLKKQLLDTQTSLLSSQLFAFDLQTSLVQVTDTFNKVSADYKALLQAGKIDLTIAKPWYEAKYGSTSFMYNYDGKGTKDIRTALRTSDAGVTLFTGAARKFILDNNLSSSSKPEDVVSSVMLYFSKTSSWMYVFDKDQFKRDEYWELAENSWSTLKGDCDDLAILMHVFIYYLLKELELEEQYWRLKFVTGRVLNEGGHAFNVWLHTDGEWYVVESTYDLRGSYNRTWLHTPVRFNNLYESFWAFARKDKSWSADIQALTKYMGENNGRI